MTYCVGGPNCTTGHCGCHQAAPMSGKHEFGEPWVVGANHQDSGGVRVLRYGGGLAAVARAAGGPLRDAIANARRIVAAVNAMAGSPVEKMQTGQVAKMAAALRALLGTRLDPNGWYEREAEAFYRETGLTAPGKDRPAATGGQDEAEAWRQWVEFRDKRIGANVENAIAALAGLDEGEKR